MTEDGFFERYVEAVSARLVEIGDKKDIGWNVHKRKMTIAASRQATVELGLWASTALPTGICAFAIVRTRNLKASPQGIGVALEDNAKRVHETDICHIYATIYCDTGYVGNNMKVRELLGGRVMERGWGWTSETGVHRRRSTIEFCIVNEDGTAFLPMEHSPYGPLDLLDLEDLNYIIATSISIKPEEGVVEPHKSVQGRIGHLENQLQSMNSRMTQLEAFTKSLRFCQCGALTLDPRARFCGICGSGLEEKGQRH